METIKIDDAVLSVLLSHGIIIPTENELALRVDLSEVLNTIVKDYSFESLHTVEAAKKKIFSAENFTKGSDCPVCDRRVQIRKYTINLLQLMLLKRLYSLQELSNPLKYFHVENDIRVPLKVGGDWAKLRHWGLIEECRVSMADGKPRSGYWRLTIKGKAFVNGITVVPKYITLYNAQFRGFQDVDDTISAIDIIKTNKKFSYTEIDNWSAQDWEDKISEL